MTEKNNATCSICGNSYHLCVSCRDSIQLTPWKMHTDTAEHYKVYQAIRGYSTGVYTKDELKIKLKTIDLSDLNSFRPHIKSLIEDVLREEVISEPVVEKIEIVEEVEEVSVEEVEELSETMIETEEMIIEKPIYSRKRSYKVEVE